MFRQISQINQLIFKNLRANKSYEHNQLIYMTITHIKTDQSNLTKINNHVANRQKIFYLPNK